MHIIMSNCSTFSYNTVNLMKDIKILKDIRKFTIKFTVIYNTTHD